ncbi:MAG: di-trans,poly-cis-decaprenylcistransferase [Phycisphaerales bacterium]|nr:di-trans,poly-cis-decaprenylcistransferase [Phycisphaerales bacterium]
MRETNPKADPLSRLPDVHPGRVPRHIAIIMDGNGRWAEQRGFPRMFGHRTGAGSVRAVVEEAGRCGVEVLTLYSFSLENWKRPTEEVQALMDLCVLYCESEREALAREGVRLKVLGREAGLPGDVLRALRSVEEATAHVKGPTLALALNYGGRAEILDAARSLCRDARAGAIDPERLSEADLAGRLYSAGLPDPDLLIRTAGEMRVSNFLLWQISYAEIHVTGALWPDFREAELHRAIRDYASRSRRFGALDPGMPSSNTP